jgi:hypothetical protein
MQKKNEIHPFDDAGSLEFLAAKNECSLFTFGSNSKKRPNNLVFVSRYKSPPRLYGRNYNDAHLCFIIFRVVHMMGIFWIWLNLELKVSYNLMRISLALQVADIVFGCRLQRAG